MELHGCSPSPPRGGHRFTRHSADATVASGRKRVLDTVLAATLESAGVSRLATFNVDDFSVFGFLEVVSPAKPAKP